MTPENEEGLKKPPFSRQSVLDKQEQAKEDYKKKVKELQVAFKAVASIPEGETVLRYIFVLSGGDLGSVRRTKEGSVDVEGTLIALGTKALWETVRFSLSSEDLKRIERHGWEEEK